MIKSMVNLESVDISEAPKGLRLNSSVDCWLDLDEQTLKQFLDALKKQIADELATINRLKSRLENKSYVENAPKKIVKETQDLLDLTNENLIKKRTQYEQFAKH